MQTRFAHDLVNDQRCWCAPDRYEYEEWVPDLLTGRMRLRIIVHFMHHESGMKSRKRHGRPRDPNIIFD